MSHAAPSSARRPARPGRAPRLPAPIRAAVAVAWAAVLIGHGLVHVAVFGLYWGLNEPGELWYSEADPEPGTAAAYLIGALWLVPPLLFGVAAVLVLIRRRLWRPLALLAALISALLIAVDPRHSLLGLLVDGLIVTATVVAWITDRRTTAPGQPARSGDQRS